MHIDSNCNNPYIDIHNIGDVHFNPLSSIMVVALIQGRHAGFHMSSRRTRAAVPLSRGPLISVMNVFPSRNMGMMRPNVHVRAEVCMCSFLGKVDLFL